MYEILPIIAMMKVKIEIIDQEESEEMFLFSIFRLYIEYVLNMLSELLCTRERLMLIVTCTIKDHKRRICNR